MLSNLHSDFGCFLTVVDWLFEQRALCFSCGLCLCFDLILLCLLTGSCFFAVVGCFDALLTLFAYYLS